MNNLKKEYPERGGEEDTVYARQIYCYLNKSKAPGFNKKKMNRRFRKFNKNISNFSHE